MGAEQSGHCQEQQRGCSLLHSFGSINCEVCSVAVSDQIMRKEEQTESKQKPPENPTCSERSQCGRESRCIKKIFSTDTMRQFFSKEEEQHTTNKRHTAHTL